MLIGWIISKVEERGPIDTPPPQCSCTFFCSRLLELNDPLVKCMNDRVKSLSNIQRSRKRRVVLVIGVKSCNGCSCLHPEHIATAERVEKGLLWFVRTNRIRVSTIRPFLSQKRKMLSKTVEKKAIKSLSQSKRSSVTKGQTQHTRTIEEPTESLWPRPGLDRVPAAQRQDRNIAKNYWIVNYLLQYIKLI